MAFGGRKGVAILGTLALSVLASGGAGTVLAPRHTLAATHAATQMTRQQSGGPSPAITAGGDATVNTPYTFDASGSQGSGLQYTWDFGDATQPATGVKVQHTYQAVNDVTVKLTVRDSAGNTATASESLRVIPAIGAFDGLPVLGQITPASAFKADLALDASGLSGFSVSVGGPLLSSRNYNYIGGGQTLVEVPTITVVNEDDPGVAPLMDESAAGIPLANNVQVNI